MQTDQPRPSRRSRLVRVILGRLALSLLLGLGIVAGLILGDVVAIPNRLNPFTPLRVADDVNWLTRLKLSRLERDREQCRAVLADAPVVHRSVADRPLDKGCGLSDAVEVSRSSIGLNREFTATCPLAVAWSLFETHVLRPVAREQFGQDVVRVVHLGTYACRNINHRAQGRRSEHATANAIDVAGFVLADGQQVTVQADWVGGNSRRSAFLRALRNGACNVFDVVLSPDYNEVHHDHFHFDMGSHRACR
ncbi:extensin family protein [Microvirga terrae]|uniref:Extensin family protein n=1 Tax=Microvirga terrae TaxID=2740529 RepID=A0ABY5RYQ1_9HYPH|nr:MULTISPECIES: extensin family protein [Microvirga]MBQ0821858.1 extensin family protein [Microvirga sp. HBU67558]UVF20902.1 extensin family protein [Microvirga terrae]